ncbi:hypothetical protein GGR57DRAFT_283133 [Xylariaceae sp. FL1272]|nr:hypothetical protein GGR57DRAFT_283133 [Xylariaceae sp. FL1272]
MSDEFELFDLRVEVVCPPGQRIMCGAKAGDYFTLQGEMLFLPPNQGIIIVSARRFQHFRHVCDICGSADDVSGTASVLPLLAAKQRPSTKNDWMTTDALIACPDPNCPSQLKIIRERVRKFNHSETTSVPLDQ